MGWGVGGRVGGGGVTLGQVTAMIDDDDDVSTIFFFFPAGLVEIPPCSAQILHRRCGVVVVAIDLARDARCGCPVIVGTKRIKPRRAPSQVNVARAQGRPNSRVHREPFWSESSPQNPLRCLLL